MSDLSRPAIAYNYDGLSRPGPVVEPAEGPSTPRDSGLFQVQTDGSPVHHLEEPSLPTPMHGTAPLHVSGIMLRAVADVAMAHHVTPQMLFGQDAERFMADDPLEVRLEISDFGALLSRAVELTGERAFALLCGLRASESSFHLITPLLAHSPTLRDAITEVRQFHALVMDGAHLHLDQQEDLARLRFEVPRTTSTETTRLVTELMTAGLVRMLRAFGCGQNELLAVCFSHRRPIDYSTYISAFGGAARFAQDTNYIEFSAKLLDNRNLHSSPSLQSVLHVQAEQRLQRLARPSSQLERLKIYMRNQPIGRMPSMNDAARDLGLSTRTLRRRLDDAGQSYRDLTQQVRCLWACTLLRNQEHTLKSIAGTLGYRDPNAFYRAFKRWTGNTATEYRSQALHK